MFYVPPNFLLAALDNEDNAITVLLHVITTLCFVITCTLGPKFHLAGKGRRFV